MISAGSCHPSVMDKKTDERKRATVTGEEILIVENDPIIGRMLEMLLKSLKYVVTDRVEDGPDAFIYATTRHPASMGLKLPVT
jgi:CheY-like chemotaxis protein